MEEHIIIQNCLKNDRVSQSKLYNLYHKVMMGVCLRYCKEVFMAEEALQNGFIKMFLSLNSYDQSRPFAPWFRRIIINSCLDQLAKNKVSILHKRGKIPLLCILIFIKDIYHFYGNMAGCISFSCN